MIDNGHFPVAPSPQIGSLLVACCRTISLNIEKTNYMIMAGPRNKVYHENCKITINGQNIIRVQNTKFLGVIIDESMSWKHHIEYICNKYSENANSCKALVIMYINTFIIFTFS